MLAFGIGEINAHKMSAPCIELERPLDNLITTALCRGCLASTGEMKNIFQWGFYEDFTKFTGIQLSSTSELLCVRCEELLMTCKKFYDQCIAADLALRQKDTKTSKETKAEQSFENSVCRMFVQNNLLYTITAPNTDMKIYLTCPYCEEKYIKQKDLLLHINKKHQKNLHVEVKFYCHHPNCTYNIHSGHNKYFQGRKFLNQHFNKVHSSKIFNCDTCFQSFATAPEFKRHFRECNVTFVCQLCDINFKNNDRLLVHLLRKHPALHKQYKENRKALKRKSKTVVEAKKPRNDLEKVAEFMCDSPKRSFATQTLIEQSITNDVALLSWQNGKDETKTDEISTQTVFEDLLSLKSQTSEDESIFFSETVSLSDIQTQTFPIEFGLSRSNKETLTSGTQSPDLSIKETQTCYCLYESPKINFRLFDSVASSPGSNLTSTETQTQLDFKSSIKSDVMLSFNSAETQTSFEEGLSKDL